MLKNLSRLLFFFLAMLGSGIDLKTLPVSKERSINRCEEKIKIASFLLQSNHRPPSSPALGEGAFNKVCVN